MTHHADAPLFAKPETSMEVLTAERDQRGARGLLTTMRSVCDGAGDISITGSAAANYTFSMDSDDGSVLFIDGTRLINHTGTLPGDPCP